MAIESNLQSYPGLKATGDLSSSQFKVVKYSSTDLAVKVVTATTDTAIGILQDKPTTGQEANVAYAGISKLVSGTTVGWTAGATVGFDTTGRGVPGQAKIVGTYLDYGESVAVGTIVSVRLHPNH